jgi:hypothetical protein
MQYQRDRQDARLSQPNRAGRLIQPDPDPRLFSRMPPPSQPNEPQVERQPIFSVRQRPSILPIAPNLNPAAVPRAIP